jgi:hypothetical protein
LLVAAVLCQVLLAGQSVHLSPLLVVVSSRRPPTPRWCMLRQRLPWPCPTERAFHRRERRGRRRQRGLFVTSLCHSSVLRRRRHCVDTHLETTP